jgi:hypothetical protein
MVYISIGNACSVKYQLNKHKNKTETLFFDWLVTSMDSVIEVLSGNIDKILNINTICITPSSNNMSNICIKTLDDCRSIHDVNLHYTDNDILKFIDKYKRRYTRIINYIQSKEKIYFIRVGSVDSYSQQKFIAAILKLNPKCDFDLIVIDNNINYLPSTIKTPHCLYIKLNIDPLDDWTCSYLNFKKIFSDTELMCNPVSSSNSFKMIFKN